MHHQSTRQLCKYNCFKYKLLWLVVFCVFFSPLAGMAANDEPVIEFDPSGVRAGESVELKVLIPLSPGLHLYGPGVPEPYYATQAKITSSGPIKWDVKPVYPRVSELEAAGETIQVLEPQDGKVTLRFMGTVSDEVPASTVDISISLTYQACSDSQCYPPVIDKVVRGTFKIGSTWNKEGQTSGKSVESEETAVVGGLEGGAEVSSGGSLEETAVVSQSGDSSEKTGSDGLGTTVSLFSHKIDLRKAGVAIPLMVAFLAGLILNIMPCVLPVIPIKILQLAKQAQHENHSPLRLAMIFSVGVVSFFLSIGVVAVILKGGFSWGQTFQSTTILMALSMILVLLALGMFDVYQVLVPKFVANRSFVQKGHIGALSMGFLAGILSTPCSFGILGAAVAWAQSQAVWLTLVGFMMIGLGMAFPYVLLSASPRFVAKIPKTGRWSELFKQSMGFLLLGVAVFLVTALPKDKVVWMLMYLVLFAFVIWFWGQVLEFKHGFWSKTAKVAGVIVLIVSGWGMLRSESNRLEWQELTEVNFTTAISSGKDVVVEFTADWCINCKTVEYFVLENELVKEALRRNEVVLLRADLTSKNPYAEKMLRQWTGQSGPPFTIIFKANGHRVLLPGIYDKQELIEAVQVEKVRSTWNRI
jgi:thiol:disulfide interchange protein